MKKVKYSYEVWLQDAALAWLKFADVKDLVSALRIPEVVKPLYAILRTKEAKSIATEMLNNPNYRPMQRDDRERDRKQTFLNFIKKLSTNDLRKLLKMKEFKELTRSCGIPVADQVE